MRRIGIVGLGIMGQGMAENFLKNDYSVFVWNRTESVSEKFAEKGATSCKSPSEVAQKADVVFEVTANDESSQEVWLNKEGILAGADKDTILVASATLSIGWIDQLIEKCNKQGFTFLDIALTGGRIGAETGNLILLCGGNAKVLDKIRPVLQAISGKIFHFGPVGHGMRYKLILNFIQAVHILGLGQAMKIAKAYDMNLEKVGEALVDRPGGVTTEKAKNTYFQDPNPITFSIDWITKDLLYAKKMAKDLDVSLLDDVLTEYEEAVSKGYGDRDWGSINTLDKDND